MIDALKEALRYARAGLAPIPVKPGDKAPILPDWPKRATTNLDEVRAMFMPRRNANVGIATGAVSGDLLVIDIDGDEGWEAFNDLQSKLGKIPDTVWVATPSGGCHVYLRSPFRPNSTRRIGPGLDTKGDGGQVVAPPSTNGVGTYHFDAEPKSGIAHIPAPWLAYIREKLDFGHTPKETPASGVSPTDAATFKHYVAEAAARIDGGAGRHDTVYWLANQIRDNGGTKKLAAQVAKLIVAEYGADNGRGEFPLSEALKEVEHVYAGYKREASPVSAPSAPLPKAKRKSAEIAIKVDQVIGIEWPDIEDIVVPEVSGRGLPRMPMQGAPPLLAEYSKALSAELQVPIEMPMLTGLVLMSAALMGKVMIQATPSWRVPPQIYAVLVAATGDRKTTVFNRMSPPFFDAMEKIRLAKIQRAGEAAAEMKIAKKEVRRLANANATTNGEREKITKELAKYEMKVTEAAQMLETTTPFLQDATPEAVAQTAAANGGKFILFDSEGMALLRLCPEYRDSEMPADIFLKATENEPFIQNRVGRDSIRIQKLQGVFYSMAQPVILEKMRSASVFKTRGAISRFLFCRPPSFAGRRVYDPGVSVSFELESEFHKVLAVIFGAEEGETPAPLSPTSGAVEFARGFHDELEPSLAKGGSRSWQSEAGRRYMSALWRLAAAIHCWNSCGLPRTPISESAMAYAVALIWYFDAHGTSMYADAAPADALDDSQYSKWHTAMKILGKLDKPRPLRQVRVGQTSARSLSEAVEEVLVPMGAAAWREVRRPNGRMSRDLVPHPEARIIHEMMSKALDAAS